MLLKFAGTVEAGTLVRYSDDGVSQKATIKNGIASKGDEIVPGVFTLTPYRTFLDVEQPASDFIFRMRENGDVKFAIFEADGGAWRNEARARIHTYLDDCIDGAPELRDQFIVIS